tara:strand:- start:963 stop:1949 length:987 start_codon:yes stop_codon:yes gene_type:complete
MKIIRYKSKDIIKAGFLFEDNLIINFDDLEISNKNNLTKHDLYVLKNNLYNVEPLFIIPLIDKNVFKIPQNIENNNLVNVNEVEILTPITKPNSFRDAYSFKQHVEAGRKARNLPMIEEFEINPVYYYSNHSSMSGPGNIYVNEVHLNKLDFELELAIVIGKEGKNIPINKADEYIFGFMILNDWSARDVQLNEMKMNLGPAKGKDFCSSIGPYLVTKNELTNKTISTKRGNVYDLNMKAFINNKQVSSDSSKNMYWTFAQIISHISTGTTIYPGDVIGSGTCATGCLYELNLTHNTDKWLQIDDEVRLEIDGLGVLENKIKLEKNNE